MSSQEELLRKLDRIYNEPELISIANLCGHPTMAEEIAKELEYSTSMLRELRYASVLKRDFLETYSKTIGKNTAVFNMNRKERSRTKYFSCAWGENYIGSSVEFYANQGTVAITPHAFLPSLFWDYELFAEEDDELVFSSKTAIPDNKRKDIRCIFTEGSRSIPVGLLLICNKHGDEFTFKRATKDNDMFWWSRTGPVGNRLSGFRGELFEAGIEDHSHSNVIQQVSLRTLGEKEKELLEPYVTQDLSDKINYHLILEEHLWDQASDGTNIKYTLEMRYKPCYDWKEKKDAKAQLVIFPLPFHNSPYGGPDYKMLTSVFHADSATAPARNRESFTERIKKMLQGTPAEIEFLPTLENFFSFKRNSDFFYLCNEGEDDWQAPLVSLKKK